MHNKLNITSPTNIYIILSLGIILLLIELFGLSFFNSQLIEDKVKEQMTFLVEFRESARTADFQNVKGALSSDDRIISNSIEEIDSTQANAILSDDINIGLLINEENPFSHMMVFNVKANKLTDNNVVELKNKIESLSGVSAFYYAENAMTQILDNINYLKRVAWITIIFISMIIAFIIFALMRVKLDKDKFRMKTMELIGADRKFVHSIYQKQSFKIALLGFVLSVLMLVGILIVVHLKIPEVAQYIQKKAVLISVLIALVAAFFIVFITTKVQINRYISKHFYQLYE